MSKIQVKPLRDQIAGSNYPYAHYTNVNFRDNVSGDLVWLYNNAAEGTIYLWTQAGDETPTQKATASGYGIISAAQDSTGVVHVLCLYGGGHSYGRITLTRSGGHVTGWSATTPFYLPAMTSSLGGSTWGATIAVVENGSAAERVVIVRVDGNDDNQYCAAVIQGPLNATADTDFASLAGVSATYTKFPTQTASLNVNAPYCFNAAIEQYGTAGNIFVVAGASSRGDVGDYGCSVVGYRAIASGSTWTVDTANPCQLAAVDYESFCLHSCTDSSGNAYFGWCKRASGAAGTVGLAKVATNGTFTASWASTTYANQGELSGFPSVCDDGTIIIGCVPGDTGFSGTAQEIKVYSGSTWYTYNAGTSKWVSASDLSWANVGSRGWANGSVFSWGATNSSLVWLGSVAVRSGSETGVLYDNWSWPRYSAAGGTSVLAEYAAAVPHATRDMHVCLVGQKPSTANSGTITFPSGWTQRGTISGAGGYGTTLGADTGNVNCAIATKDSVDGAESGTISVTLATNNVAWAMMVRLTKAGDGDWAYASTTGSDVTTGAALSVTYDSAIDLAPGDLVVIGWWQPTDVTTPKQFTGQALAASGITFSEVTVLAEPGSDVGNDIGGWVGFARVLAGTGSVTPTFSATASGTTTNVRGGSVLLRVREAASAAATTSVVAAVAGGAGAALVVQTVPATTAAITAVAGGPGSALLVQAQLPVSANVSATAGGPGSALLATTSPMIAASVAAAAGGPISAANATLTVDAAVAAIGGGPISSAVVSTFPETSSAVAAVAGGPTSGASVELTIVSAVAGIAGGPVSSAVAENEPFASVAVTAVAGGPTSSAAVSSPLYVAVSATAGGPVAAMIATNSQRVITAGDRRRFVGTIVAGDRERT